MKYKCVVLDHDDTVVDSTRQIHYPAFMVFLEKVRPGVSLSFAEYMQENFNPGFLEFCLEKLAFTEKEMEEEVKFWENYVKGHIPSAYDGFKKLLNSYKAQGGIICVVSHSLSANILRDYKANDLPIPDEIYGWERPIDERKPSPYPIYQIMKKYNLKSNEIIMVDDLKPGYDMARESGIDFAAAGWAYELPKIRDYMMKNSDYYLRKVEELGEIIL